MFSIIVTSSQSNSDSFRDRRYWKENAYATASYTATTYAILQTAI